MGVSAFIGIGIVISALPVQVYVAKYITKLRLKVGEKCDERLQMLQETLSSIKMIKMYTWEKYFGDGINSIRRKELGLMLLGFILRFSMFIVSILIAKIAFYVLIVSYIYMGYETDTTLLFYIWSCFKDIKRTFCIIVSTNLAIAGEFFAAISRINRLMKAEEYHLEDEKIIKPVVELEHAMVHIGEKTILEDITFRVDSGLTVITGEVGSGKSSLLKTILHDYPLSNGRMSRRDSISYASQDPWLFPSTIKQNILFDQDFEEKNAPATPTAHIILDAEAETPETTIESEVDHTGKMKNTPKLMQQIKTTNAPEATEGNRKQSKPATTQIQTLAQEKRLRSTSR
ncbi:hypothetical protein JTB14_024651 [Gonioctena quinquepunctata]|nr:hypothetical protein JTB14_024651 [Gonioctena quinquepunctata]